MAGFLIVAVLMVMNLGSVILFKYTKAQYRDRLRDNLAVAAGLAREQWVSNIAEPKDSVIVRWSRLINTYNLSAIGIADSNGNWLAATDPYLLEIYIQNGKDSSLTWKHIRPGALCYLKNTADYGFVNYSIVEGLDGNILVLLAPAGFYASLELADKTQNYAILVIFLSVLLLLFIYLRSIFTPFRAMAAMAGQDQKTESTLGTDVEFVMDTYRKMIEQLKQRGLDLKDLYDREKERSETLEHFSRQILESVDKGIISLDLKGRVLTCNPAARNMFGAGDIASCDEIFDRTESELILNGIRQIVKEIEGPAGTRKIIQIDISPLRDQYGKPAGRNLVMSDVTDARKIEELEELSEKSMVLENASLNLLVKVRPAIIELKRSLEAPFDSTAISRQIEEFERLVAEYSRYFKVKTESQARDEATGLIYESDEMKEVMGLVDRVAPAGTTVLITGDSGTGKELVAREIHNRSPRSGKPFITINCAALPENLLESELFGYVKGAFTGAGRDKPGLLKAADGGSFFFDEIGELPGSLQAKILRAIQEKEVTPVGSTRPITIDVRMIAASNRDLGEMVGKGIFRQDLYYRLNVFPIHLRPLCQRTKDISALADHFVAKYSRKNGRNIKGVDGKALDMLLKYPWPGNVRELENIMERAVLFAKGTKIKPEDLNITMPEETSSAMALNGGLLAVGAAAASKAEAEMIKKVLAETEGNKSEASRRLKISYRVMLKKIKDYGLE